MQTTAAKTQDQSKAVANSFPKLESSSDTSIQFVDDRPEAIAQRKTQEAINNSPRVRDIDVYQEMANNSTQVKQLSAYQAMAEHYTSQIVQKKENKTGLPDQLKSGMENLAGMSLDDVKVHRNSDKPAQLQAHAYAQGSDVHLGPGQEKHLPHETWHVVQQKQGRVQATMQMKQNVGVNNDAGLEHEADVMGEKALQMQACSVKNSPVVSSTNTNTVTQFVLNWAADVPEKTAGDNYGLSANHKTLYSKPGGAAPQPTGMYAQGVDRTDDPEPIALRTWKSNVKFLKGSVIDHGHAPSAEETVGWRSGAIARPTDEAKFAELNPHYLRIKGEVAAKMAEEPEEGGASPTMGIVGRNDCAQWAEALQGLIHQTQGHVADAAQANFNLGGAEEPNMEGAPGVGLGDKMEQTLGGGSASGHHGATVVATDGASLVTLEAHVEKELTEPEFHIHAGLSGFVDSNNAGAGGERNTYLGANGRRGHVKPLGSARIGIQNRMDMLGYYSGALAADDVPTRLGAIQAVLRFYEQVVPEVEAVEAEEAPAEAPAEAPVREEAPPSGGGGKSKGKCFLTTACVNYRNLPDDCEELTVLRDFRDNYMRKLPEGNSLIEKYYEVAPAIVDKIELTANRRDIYDELYLILRRCVEAIKQGNHSLALEVYKEMVIKLHEAYR